MAPSKRISRKERVSPATRPSSMTKPSSSRKKTQSHLKPHSRPQRSAKAVGSSQVKASAPPNYFMQLPREIRDKIYDYAFLAERFTEDQPLDMGLGPSTGSKSSDIEDAEDESSEVSSNQIFSSYSTEADILCRESFFLPSTYNIGKEDSPRYSKFWGLEPMTRLLRTSRPIYHEASKVLYAQLKLHWDADITREEVQKVLNQLSAPVRGFIRSVRIEMSLRVMKHRRDEYPDTIKIPRKHAIAWMSWLLPGLKKVYLKLGFSFTKGQRLDEEQTVKLALDILSPFQYLDLKLLEVGGGLRWHSHNISQEVDERLAMRMNNMIQSGKW